MKFKCGCIKANVKVRYCPHPYYEGHFSYICEKHMKPFKKIWNYIIKQEKK